MFTIKSNRPTWLKKLGSEGIVSAALLPEDKKFNVEKTVELKIIAHKDIGQDHWLVTFDQGYGTKGYNTWAIYVPHWDLPMKRKSGMLGTAQWFPQTDNSIKPNATCNISACASFASVYTNVNSDEELIREVFHRMGANSSTDHTLLTTALWNRYGLDTVFDYGMSWDLLEDILGSGQPVVMGILHHGTSLAPYGGGHMICAVDRVGYSKYKICDPWGSLNDGYKGSVSNGKNVIYTYQQLKNRWTVDGPGSGWGRYLRDWEKYA